MRFAMKRILIFAVMFAAATAGAEEIKPETLDQLLKLSGLEKQIAEIPGTVRMGFEQERQRGQLFSEAVLSDVFNSIDEAFRPSDILRIIRMEVKKNVSESDARDLLAWYGSDVGKEITKIEEDNSTPAAQQEIMQNCQSMHADKQRMDIAKELNELTNGTDLIVAIYKNTAYAAFIAISKARNPVLQPTDLVEFESGWIAQEPQMRASLEQFLILSTAYTYKDVEIESLKQYLEFNAQPATKAMNDSFCTGIKYALSVSIDKLYESLAASLMKHESAPEDLPAKKDR